MMILSLTGQAKTYLNLKIQCLESTNATNYSFPTSNIFKDNFILPILPLKEKSVLKNSKT